MFKTVILFLAILGLVFVVAPYFNYAIFNFQCQSDSCNVCHSTRVYNPHVLSCESTPESLCSKDCKPRNHKCSFDQDFKKPCLDCIGICKNKFTGQNENQSLDLKSCFANCYSRK